MIKGFEKISTIAQIENKWEMYSLAILESWIYVKTVWIHTYYIYHKKLFSIDFYPLHLYFNDSICPFSL